MREQDQPNFPPMTAQDYSEVQDWPGYFGAVLGKPPRETLVTALDSFAREGFAGGLAVDLAAGRGKTRTSKPVFLEILCESLQAAWTGSMLTE